MLRKFALFLIISLFLVQIPGLEVNAQTDTSRKHQEGVIESRMLDPRAEILTAYLAKYNSPLQYHAQDFVDAADTFGVDYKLVPAIAGVESTFGHRIPGGNNAWGWGIYGDNRIYFNSWREAIFTITRGLKEGYIDKGLTDPYSMNRKYASSPTWGTKVAYFMGDIERFAAQVQTEQTQIVPENTDPQAKILDHILLSYQIRQTPSEIIPLTVSN